MNFRIALLTAAVFGLLTSIATPVQAQLFQITLENRTTPGANNGQPFSPPVFVTHDETLSLWTVGEAASVPVQQVAEEGDNFPLLSDLNTQLGTGVLSIVTPTGGPLLPGESVTFTIAADSSRPFLSTIWMLGRTNDGFSGLTGLNLLTLGAGTNTIDLVSLDAGTEVNNESAAFLPALGGVFNDPEGGVVTTPHPGILGIGDAPTSWNWEEPVARLTISQVAAPEPGTLALLTVGGLCTALVLRRRTR
jgi:hypothetical protein